MIKKAEDADGLAAHQGRECILARFRPEILSDFNRILVLFRLFGYNRCEVQQICTQKNFSKFFVAIGKKSNSGAHILWGSMMNEVMNMEKVILILICIKNKIISIPVR